MDDIAQLSKDIGELTGTVSALTASIGDQREDIGKLFGSINGVKLEISKLPCSEHQGRLCKVEGWQTTHNGVDKDINMEKIKGSISLRNALIGGTLIAVISQIPAIILLFQKACGS